MEPVEVLTEVIDYFDKIEIPGSIIKKVVLFIMEIIYLVVYEKNVEMNLVVDCISQEMILDWDSVQIG